MAAIAGRHADGFNTQARHPRLAELVRVAREEHAAAGRDVSRFVLTVFAGLDRQWLRPDSTARASLTQLEVDRLILLVSPPFDSDQIRAAGSLLRARA
jgi:alkanesulfonate monooxygenase SsuD/methylene tetrahydromethanopterin reductase-like flavin-dependent oxidoreductase (luciferase family)